MNYFTTFAVIATLVGSAAAAQDMEIAVPNGWTATASGIAKDNSELFVGPVLDLGDLDAAGYLATLADVPTEGLEITNVGELKDGDYVAQVTRDVTQDGEKARSILFICKGGRNENRLLELVTDDVFAVISGGKAAIAFCAQT